MSTKFINHLFYLGMGVVATIASMPESAIALVPAKYKPLVAAVVAIAVWIKGHNNLPKEEK